MLGGAEDLERDLAAIVGDAGALGYAPLHADALLAQGTFYLQRGEYARAEEPLRLAHAEALRSRDYRSAVEAFARLAWLLSKQPGVPAAQALDGIAQIGPLADGLSTYARFAQSLLHNNLGSIALATGDSARARSEYETAIGLARDVTGPGAIELSAALEGLALITETPDVRDRFLEQRIALLQHGVGETHPLTLRARITAALTRASPSEARARLAGPCHQLAELHPTGRAAIAECSFELGWLDLEADQLDDARRDFALAAQADPGGSFAQPAAAYRAAISDDPAGAARTFAALVAGIAVDAATPWHRRFHLARLEIGLGLAAEATGKRVEAREAYLRARAHLDAASQVRRWAPMTWRAAWLERRLR
jgi:tetratricopeptide (TPR) repeat protein